VGCARESRNPVGQLAVADQRSYPIAAAHRQVHDRGDRGEHEFALLGERGAEVDARRQVDDQPRLQFAVGDGLPHVRDRGSRGDRPIHAANVVAGHVLPRLPRLGAGAGHQTEVVALQQPVELVAHAQLESAQQRFGRREVERRTVRVRLAHNSAR